MKVDIQNIKYRYYLASHISLQKVLQIDKLILYKAEDGPFKMTQKWISLIGLFEANKHRMYTYPILKMRSSERSMMSKALKIFNISIFD
jgi:hypothetical protein